MATFTSPADAVPSALARAAQLNNLDSAVVDAFALLPTNAQIDSGTITFAVDSGAADAYVVALPQTATAYVDGMTIVMRPTNNNTGASTINVDGLGVKDIKSIAGGALGAGDIVAGSPVILIYSSTSGDFHLQAATVSPAGTIAVGSGGTGVTTLADGGLVIGDGTNPVDVVAAGATDEILVGGGASTNPVWTTATGTGAPVRESSPALVTPDLGIPTAIGLTNATGLPVSGIADPELLGRLAVPSEWTSQQNFNEVTVTKANLDTDGWNLNTQQCAIYTLTANTTVIAPTNMKAGGHYTLRVIQAAGLYTLAWNAAFKFGVGAPDEPAADGDVVIFSFYSDGTNMYGIDAVREEA